MRKTTVQAIIDILLIIAFVLFVVLYSKLEVPKVSLRSAWVCAFLLMISVICFTKFFLYRRQNFLFFALTFLTYLIVLVANINKFDAIITHNFGIFVMIPGILLSLFYLRFRELYQLRCGICLILAGLILIAIFG